MEHETVSQACPECGHIFLTLDDEVGTHPCPHCGYYPEPEDEDEKND